MRSTVRDTGAAIGSQARMLLLNRTLWSTRHLVGALRLAGRWAVAPDGTAPPPLAVAWYLTHACPEACDFCNVSRALDAETPALPLERAKDLVDRLVPAVPVVALGGGEPAAYPGLVPLIEHIHARGGRVSLVTAATSLGPTKAAALADAGPEMVMVSLLGDEATHDRRMGRAGAHRRAVATIERLVERRDPRRTRIILNCTVGPDDADAIEAVARAGRDLGVDAVRFTWLSFMGASEAALAPRAHPYLVVDAPVAAPDARRGLIAAVAAARRAHPGFVDFLPHLTDAELDAWFGGGGLRRPCLSLWHTLFLRPDGHAVPCGHMQEDPVGDATREPLGAFWNGDAMKRVRMAQRAGPFAMCARCCKN